MANDLAAAPSQHVMEAIDNAKKFNSASREYWLARRLRVILGYETWRNFENAIERARASCATYGKAPEKHFVETVNMVEVGGGAKRPQKDYFLSRYACRLIAMNGDTTKVEIASAQAYFIVQTHRMEQIDETDQATKDHHRLRVRERVTNAVKRLGEIARDVGVEKFGFFNAARWHGLYGKSSMAAIRKAKGVPEGEDLLNRLGSWELSVHDFQIGLTARRILDEDVKGQEAATAVNRQTAESVRQTIIDNIGYGPEDVPVEEPIQEVQKRIRQDRKPKELSSPID